ncbi:unnamed protein product, partial [Closterium sp. Yama58-4]
MDRQYDYLQDQEGGGFASGWPATDQVPGQQQPHSSLPGQQQPQPGDQGFLDTSNDRPAGQDGPGLSGRPVGLMVSAEFADEGKPGGGGVGTGGSAGATGAGFAGKGVAGGASAAGGGSTAGGGSASRGESSLARILSLEELSTGELRFGKHAELDSAVGKAREGASGGAAGGLGEGGAEQAAAGGLPVVTVTGEERKRMVAALRDGRDRARDRTRHLQDALSRLDTWLNGVSMRRRAGRSDGANATAGGGAASAGGASGAAGMPGDNSRSSGSAGDGGGAAATGAGGGLKRSLSSSSHKPGGSAAGPGSGSVFRAGPVHGVTSGSRAGAGDGGGGGGSDSGPKGQAGKGIGLHQTRDASGRFGSVGVSEGGGEGDEEGYGGEEMDGEGGGGGRDGGGLWPAESGSVGGLLGGAGESLGGAGGGAGGEAGGLSEVQSRGTGLAKVRRKDKKGKLGRVREKAEGGGGIVKEEGGGGGGGAGGAGGGADGVRRQGRTGRLVAAGALRLKKEAVSSVGSEGADDGGLQGSGTGGAASAAGGGGSGGGGSGGGGAGGVVGVANNVKQIRTSRLGLDKGERGGRIDRRNAANRVQRRMHADSPMEESGDSDDDAEELSNAIQAAMNTGAAAASSPFWKAVEPFFHFPAPEDLARLRQMSGATEGAAGARADGHTDPTTGIPAGDAESHPSGVLHALPSLMAVTPAGGNRSPAGGLEGAGGGLDGSGGGGREWGGVVGESMVHRVRLELAHVGLLRVNGLQESQRQDDEISASLRMSHRRLQAKAQHNQHKAAYLEEVVASRRLEEERSCEKLVVDRLLEMAYARRTGLKMAGAAGTITKGAGSSLKLARQSAVHFVRRALQRADQWHAGTLLPHLQRVHPDLQPSPSLLAEPSPLPWTPGPGGVGTPGLGGVGRSSGVVTTPGGTPSAAAGAAASAAAGAADAGGAGAGGLDGSGAGLSGAGASAPSLLALFNRQRLALFPPSPPRPPIPLSFAPTAATTAAPTAAGGTGANENVLGGESPALEIAGLSPLRGAGGEEGGAGGAAGGVQEAETDSLVASMLIAGSPCDSFRE